VSAAPLTPDAHLRLHFLAAVLLVRRGLPPARTARDLLGFLTDYDAELTAAGLEAAIASPDRWWADVAEREAATPRPLPLARLRGAAGLDPLAMTLLFAIALPEEDGRFGVLAEALGAPARRPTLGLVTAWGRHSAPPTP
jgi:hypothetical protein